MLTSAVSCQAEECKNPQRDLPIGIIGSLSISTTLYIAVSLVLVGMVPYQRLDGEVGVSAAFGDHGLVWAEYLIDLGALVGMTSVLLVNIMAQPRVTLAMARDGLLPISFFGSIHPQYHTPHKATLLTGIIVAALASLIPLSVLVELVSIGTLLAFFIVCCSVLMLRYTCPQLPRPFRCPWVPVIPTLGAFLCLMLMLSLPGSNWYRLGIWLAIGLTIYFCWGKKNARKVKAMRDAEDLFQAEIGKEEGGVPEATSSSNTDNMQQVEDAHDKATPTDEDKVMDENKEDVAAISSSSSSDQDDHTADDDLQEGMLNQTGRSSDD